MKTVAITILVLVVCAILVGLASLPWSRDVGTIAIDWGQVQSLINVVGVFSVVYYGPRAAVGVIHQVDTTWEQFFVVAIGAAMIAV